MTFKTFVDSAFSRIKQAFRSFNDWLEGMFSFEISLTMNTDQDLGSIDFDDEISYAWFQNGELVRFDDLEHRPDLSGMPVKTFTLDEIVAFAKDRLNENKKQSED